MKLITEILTVHTIRDITATSKDAAIRELCELVGDNPAVRDIDSFYSAIRSREAIMSTGIGMGIAIPHAKTSFLQDFVMAVGRSKEGIDFDSHDGLPVHIIILIGANDTQGEEFLRVLAEVGYVFKDESFAQRFLEAETPATMLTMIRKRFE